MSDEMDVQGQDAPIQESDPGHMYQDAPESRTSLWKWILVGLVIAYVLGSGYFIVVMKARLERLEHSDENARGGLHELNQRLSTVQASNEALASQLGITKKELSQRASDLQRQQRASEARLAVEQQQQLSKMSGEVAGVRSDVGGVKSDVAAAKSDLEATKEKLDRAIGDLGVQSGLIAHTRDDLEALKHQGDRNYYEFALQKKANPTPISTVSLQLKKADAKKGKFTLNVLSDDRMIEKKDRTINEPIQFYSGREHMLYEVVVWTVDKNRIAGYLSTPKSAPRPVLSQTPQGAQ